MKVKKLINSAALFSICLGSLTAVLPEATMATTASVTSGVYQSQTTTSSVYPALTTSVPVNQPLALEATANSCTPYGPAIGYQYDPKVLMELMGKPRSIHYGPFLSAHRGVWGTNLGNSDSGVPLVNAAENSKTAIDNAAKLKFEMVELDVKAVSDGKLVLMHDYTLGRTTKNGRESNDQWDVFRQITPSGKKPEYKPGVEPKVLTDDNWNHVIKPYNPLVSQHEYSYIKFLKLFDKSSNNDLGSMTVGDMEVKAKGQWGDTPNNDAVDMLNQTLSYIGNNYPGMTVVLDLRHLNEVKEAMNVIDQLKDCQGNPASNWVILKPFANVFKGGFFNAYNVTGSDPAYDSVIGLIGPRAYNYKWIPVLSNRLVPPTPKGEPSVIPGSPGPDASQIVTQSLPYVNDWWQNSYGSTVTIENGYNGDGNPSNPLKSAYEEAIQRSTNLQSWRPPDIRVEGEEVVTNKGTVIGFNWKDDGMGAYPVYKAGYKDYSEQRKTAGILTVEDAPYVMKLEALTRVASTRVISKVVDWSKFDTNAVYKIVEASSGKALGMGDLYGSSWARINDYSGSDGELWKFKRKGNNTASFNIILPFVPGWLSRDLVLNLPAADQYVHTNSLTDYESNPDTSWALAGSGAFSIINGNLKTMAVNDVGTGAIAKDGIETGNKFFVIPVADYTLQQADTGWVADIDHDKTDNGTPVLSFEKRSGYQNQKWRFLFNTDGTYTIFNPMSSKVLTGDEYKVSIYSKSNDIQQRWELKYQKETDTYALANRDKETHQLQYLNHNGYSDGLYMGVLNWDWEPFIWKMTKWNP
jgi:glycerophosphoryl diester phosphodiesterase